MTYLFWPLLGGLAAVALETTFRLPGREGYFIWPWLPVSLVGALIVNYSIWRTVSSGPSLLVSLVIFGLFTNFLRILSSHFLLDEPVSRGNMVAALALFTGAVAGKLWR